MFFRQTRPGFHVVDGFVVVHGIDLAETIGNLGPAVVLNSQAAMLAAIEKSNGIVIDCRYGEAAAPPLYFLDFYLRTVLPFFVTGSVPLGSQRYRQHNGYAAQGGASGGYSLLVTRAPDVIVGRAQIKKPLAVLIDARSSGLLPVWSGLQAAGAKIVVIGEASERVNSYRLSLPEGVRVNLRVAEFVSPAGESIFQPDVRLASEANTADQAVLAAIGSLQRSDQTGASSTRAVAQALKGQYDNPYPEMRFPPEEYRLLALFRFWSVINYFYPYKQLTDKPWDTVLTDFIPMFLDNKSALDYQTTVAQMAARMQDSHGSVRGLEELDNHLGMFAPPVRLASAGGQVVVVALPDAAHAADLRLGDVILNIDGEPVSQRIAALATLRSLSTPQAAYDFIYPALLRGARDTAVELRVIGTDGRARQVTVARSVPLTSVSGMMPRRTPVYQVLPNGYGYIDLARLLMPDVTKAMDAVMDTPALIFDMRGYPNGTGLALVQRLNDRPNVTNALFRRPFQEAINLDNLNFGGGAPDYAFEQELPRGAGTAYKGRVVMLINEFAISQAEHICMAFESATNVTFIGGPTNGADGGVTNMVLPGAIYVTFTGDDVRHGDGRQLQRIGIQPMIKVEPTPRGIGEGRDEVMEAAIRYLETTPRK